MTRPLSLLLIEDDANDAFFVKDALHRAGVDLPLQIATDGQQAIDHLKSFSAESDNEKATRPALVLLDLNLPRRTGLEVLKWIRQESPCRTLVVIVLTSSTSESDMNQAYLLGANSYIIKPTDATKLRDMIQLLKSYWLSWNQIPREPRAPHIRPITSSDQARVSQ